MHLFQITWWKADKGPINESWLTHLRIIWWTILFIIYIFQFLSFSSSGPIFILQLCFSTICSISSCIAFSPQRSMLLTLFSVCVPPPAFYPSHFVTSSLRKFWGATIRCLVSIFLSQILSLLLKEIAWRSTYRLQNLRNSLSRLKEGVVGEFSYCL